MNKGKYISLVIVISVISLAVFAIVKVKSTQGQNKANPIAAKVLRKSNGDTNSQNPQVRQDAQPTEKELDDAATPIVDFDSAPLHQNSKRSAKNNRFKEQSWVSNIPVPQVVNVERSTGDSSFNTPTDLPVEQSDLIVEGKIIDGQAFLSDDKSGIYSEFTIKVSKVLYEDSTGKVKNGDSVIAERVGGRVRYPSGQIVRYNISNQGSPVKNKKYLLFLKKTTEGDYELLTAYEQQNDVVKSLDGSKAKLRGGKNNKVYLRVLLKSFQ
jgi:hypothetical protein